MSWIEFFICLAKNRKMYFISSLDGLISLRDQQTSWYSVRFLRVIRKSFEEKWGLVDMWHEPDFLQMSLEPGGVGLAYKYFSSQETLLVPYNS